MTQLELDAIRDRLTRVTPGPWGTIPPGGPNGPFWGICNRMGNIVAMRLTDRQGDATFIAYARDDVPLLLAEVDRLRDLLRKADEVIRDLDEDERYPFGWESYETEIRP